MRDSQRRVVGAKRSIERLMLRALLVVACTSIASAQYNYQPTRVATFRIFDSAGKAITDRSSDYSVTVRRVGREIVGDIILFQWQKEVLYYGDHGSRWDPLLELVVARGADTMIVTGSEGIDSIRFMPGRFHIPTSYMHLFDIHRHVATLRPTLEEFRVGGDSSWRAANIIDTTDVRYTYAHSIANTAITGMVAIGDIAVNRSTGTLIAIIGETDRRGAPIRQEWPITSLYRKERSGEMWKKLEHPFGRSVLRRVVFEHGAFLLYANNGSMLLARSTDDGRTWHREPARPDWHPERAPYSAVIDEDTTLFAFAALDRWRNYTYGEGPWQLVLHSNLTGHRRTLLEGVGSRPLLHFHDDQTGVLLTATYLLMTTDGGSSWTYRPFDSIPGHPTWSSISSATQNGWTDFLFLDERTLLAFDYRHLTVIHL